MVHQWTDYALRVLFTLIDGNGLSVKPALRFRQWVRAHEADETIKRRRDEE